MVVKLKIQSNLNPIKLNNMILSSQLIKIDHYHINLLFNTKDILSLLMFIKYLNLKKYYL